MTGDNRALLLHEYQLDINKSPATTRAVLKRLLQDVRDALEEHGHITIFVERGGG